VRSQRSASFLQAPAWATVKSEWRHESLGWFEGDELVGAGLVLYRQLPRLRRYLAYLPEGPLLDWSTDDLRTWLSPLARHLRSRGAFGIRMGPPVVVRRWSADLVKAGLADPAVASLDDLAPSERLAEGARVVSQLNELGWRLQGTGTGFSAGQPRFNFQLPLAGRDEDDVLRDMNQQWRRNIKKADKAGVVVSTSSTTGNDSTTGAGSTTGDGSTTEGGAAGRPTEGLASGYGGERGTSERVSRGRAGGGATPGDVKAFHDLYVETARRDYFTPRPLSYFETMFAALGAEEPDRIRLYLAHHDGDLVAATIAVRVGAHVWYSYGASSADKREVRGSNAVQWAMIRDALAAGADVYDLRGITDTLDPHDAHAGLIQFKVGIGGEAVEYAGEWDLPLNTLLYKAFSAYMSRR